MREPVEPEAHRDLGCDRADRPRGDRVDRRLFLATRVPELVHPFAELDRAAARSEHDRDAAALLEVHRRWIEPGIGQGLLRGGDRHRHDARDVPEVLRVDPGGGIEILHLTGDAARECGRVEKGDRLHAGASAGDRCEVVFAADAVRCDGADAGDDDAGGEGHASLESGVGSRESVASLGVLKFIRCRRYGVPM